MSVDTFSRIYVPIAAFVVLFSLGMGLSRSDFVRVVRRPKAFILGLICQLVLLPLIAWLLCHALPIAPSLAIGFVVLAACPGSAPALLFTRLARGDVMLALTLTATTCLLSAAYMPWVTNLAIEHFGRGDEVLGDKSFSVLRTSLSLFAICVVPILMGMAFRGFRPALAQRVEPRATALGVLLLAVMLVWFFAVDGRAVRGYFGQTGVISVMLNLSVVGTAYVGGWMFGCVPAERVALAIQCSCRQFAMAAFVALTIMDSAQVLVPAITYTLISYATAAVVVVVTRGLARQPVLPSLAAGR